MSRLTNLTNIGPCSAARLEAVGIRTADDLERLGAVAAWLRVEHAFPRETSVVLLYALQGALLGLRWNTLPEALQRALAAEARSVASSPGRRADDDGRDG